MILEKELLNFDEMAHRVQFHRSTKEEGEREIEREGERKRERQREIKKERNQEVGRKWVRRTQERAWD